jgi:hypothetical protein
MRIECGFTELGLTSHAGLPALTQVLKAARLGAAFVPLLKTIPEADIFTVATPLLAPASSTKAGTAIDFAPPAAWLA